jgi:hypothetical protein
MGVAAMMIVGAPAGFSMEATGTSKAAAAASHQTKCLDAAECFRSKNDASAARVKTIVTPTACSTRNFPIITTPPSLLC